MSVDIEVEPEAEEVVVVDGYGVFGHLMPILKRTFATAVYGSSTADGLDLRNTARSNCHPDGSVLAEHPVEYIVIISDRGNASEYKVCPYTNLVLAVYGFIVAPSDVSGVALK